MAPAAPGTHQSHHFPPKSPFKGLLLLSAPASRNKSGMNPVKHPPAAAGGGQLVIPGLIISSWGLWEGGIHTEGWGCSKVFLGLMDSSCGKRKGIKGERGMGKALNSSSAERRKRKECKEAPPVQTQPQQLPQLHRKPGKITSLFCLLP